MAPRSRARRFADSTVHEEEPNFTDTEFIAGILDAASAIAERSDGKYTVEFLLEKAKIAINQWQETRKQNLEQTEGDYDSVEKEMNNLKNPNTGKTKSSLKCPFVAKDVLIPAESDDKPRYPPVIESKRKKLASVSAEPTHKSPHKDTTAIDTEFQTFKSNKRKVEQTESDAHAVTNNSKKAKSTTTGKPSTVQLPAWYTTGSNES
jgi:hypothetical protein